MNLTKTAPLKMKTESANDSNVFDTSRGRLEVRQHVLTNALNTNIAGYSYHTERQILSE